MKNSLMSPETRFKVAHCVKNCINLDSAEDDSSDDNNFTFEDSSSQSASKSHPSCSDIDENGKRNYLGRLSFGYYKNRAQSARNSFCFFKDNEDCKDKRRASNIIMKSNNKAKD